MGISHDICGPRGVVVDACIGRTQVEALLDTGATTDLIRIDIARDLSDSSEIEPYRGRLETSDGQEMKMDGCITARLNLGAVDKDLDMLVVPKLKAEMVFGLRSLKETRCTLTFSHDEDFLWTGVKEGSIVPIRYLPPNASPERMLSTPHDPGGKSDGEGYSSNEKRRQLIAEIAASVEQSDGVPSDEEGWPATFDDHSAGAICENMDDDEIACCHKAISLEEALRKCRPTGGSELVASVNETATNEDNDSESIRWKRTPGGVAKMQKEDEAICQVFYWEGLCDETNDIQSLGTNIISKEQAMQYGPETLAYWSRWDKLSFKDGLLYKKWFQRDDSRPILLTILPVAGWKEILSQFDLMENGGGQLAAEKMLARLRRRYWWPTMRTDFERKVQWCLSRSVHMTEIKTKRAEGLAPFDPGIRFSAVDILGPVTKATSTRAKQVLVSTDLFTMSMVAVPLVSTDFANVAREIVENWALKFGAPNVLPTDQGKSFGGKLTQDMSRLLSNDKTHTSPYKSKGNGQTDRHTANMANVI